MEELKVNNMSKECDNPSASFPGKCTSQNCTGLSRNAMMFHTAGSTSRRWPEENGNIWSRFILKAFSSLADKRLHPHPRPQISQFH